MEPVVKKTFLISYDLYDAEPEVYENLFDYFESFGSWAHITDSLWAVKTEKTAIEIRDAISKLIPNKSRIFIVKSGVASAWSNVICSNKWLKDNL